VGISLPNTMCETKIENKQTREPVRSSRRLLSKAHGSNPVVSDGGTCRAVHPDTQPQAPSSAQSQLHAALDPDPTVQFPPTSLYIPAYPLLPNRSRLRRLTLSLLSISSLFVLPPNSDQTNSLKISENAR
jgi:hypothetical protein